MNKGILNGTSLGSLLVLLVVIPGCVIQIGGGPMSARYERQVTLSAPLQPGSAFAAQTSDGSITVEGAQVTECNVIATIVARAMTEEAARELAEAIKIKLEPTANGLATKIEKPLYKRNRNFSVSFDVTTPDRTDLQLTSSDGSVKVADIAGKVEAKTSDGSISVEDTNGDAKLRTSDGSITCTKATAGSLELHTSDGSIRILQSSAETCDAHTSDGNITVTEVKGDNLILRTSDGGIKCRDITAGRLNCRTSDGPVHIQYAKDVRGPLDVRATTSDGSITFVGPAGLSAVFDAYTSDGSIHTELPIAVTGKIGKSLRGTIGTGEGKVYLKTGDGSITIK
ncbi:MAG: DUF4097 family beta strand repeat protein [Phycisphaerales bacterium]|nr:MAG: DUF4097 family beta strand repeat protein [Phycisphaerales bacterium]